MIVIVIHFSTCSPHSDTHTLVCVPELLCHIAERSSKHRRHSAPLPGSCSSKSCPWSDVVGGQLLLGQATQSSCMTAGYLKKQQKKNNSGVRHWPHVALMSLLSVTLVMVSLSLYVCLFICQLQLLIGLELFASKLVIPIGTQKLCTCATILKQSAV